MTEVDPVLTEEQRASPFAELTIEVGPDRRWGTAKGSVPADQAHHMITTTGIVVSSCVGIGSAVLTLRIGPALTTVALAELALALTAALLTAACSLTRNSRMSAKVRQTDATSPGDRGTTHDASTEVSADGGHSA